MLDFFLLTFVMNASGVIAGAMGIIMIVCLLAGMDRLHSWLALVFIFAIAIGLNVASSSTLRLNKDKFNQPVTERMP